ncbi:MAG: EamA family transporter, partial [Chthoniobacterales bacterium]
RKNELHFAVAAPGLDMLLVSTGIVTGLPLVWFAHAARHLRLTTVGFLQYLSPSCTFFLGVFAYHEPFRRTQMVTFVLIWIALAIFTADAVSRWRERKRPPLRPIQM